MKASIAVTPPSATAPAYAEGGGKRVAADNQALVTMGRPQARHGHVVEFRTDPHQNGGQFAGSPPGTAPRTRADLPNAATQAGRRIASELTTEIDRLAQAHAQVDQRQHRDQDPQEDRSRAVSFPAAC